MLYIFILLSIASAASINPSGIDVSLVPEYGIQSGVNPKDNGSNCDGITKPDGTVVQIPCNCPPPRDFFIGKLREFVAAGSAGFPGTDLTFPSGDSREAQFSGINAALITLQNLNGSGVGCPAASTNWLAIK